MIAPLASGEAALCASSALMLLVLAVRAPVRRWFGPRLAYALWTLPAVRMVLPGVPVDAPGVFPLAARAARGMSVLFVGPGGTSAAGDAPVWPSVTAILLVVWALGAIGLFAICAVRHRIFCRRVRATGTQIGLADSVPILAADIAGPLAFGVFRRCIAVPRTFDRDYSPRERRLALAHERAHHARGDLLANWASLVVLAAHWWNPVAWVAIRAFRDDQEYAADAHVLAGAGAGAGAGSEPGAPAAYATVLAKAAGIGALPACNLNARSNLKGRLMLLARKPVSGGRVLLGAAALALLGSAALAATVATPRASRSASGRQAVTIGVKPDGSGGYALIVGGKAVAPGAPLSRGATLPADLDTAGGCNLKPDAKPHAMVIKGLGKTQTYTVMCASAAAAPVHETLAAGLVSLNTMRASVATQPATSAFPEAERTHVLGAIDRSIREVEAQLAVAG